MIENSIHVYVMSECFIVGCQYIVGPRLIDEAHKHGIDMLHFHSSDGWITIKYPIVEWKIFQVLPIFNNHILNITYDEEQ